MSISYIITEFEHDDLPTGVAARVRHLKAALPEASVVSVHSRPRKEVTLQRRMRAVKTFSLPKDAQTAIVVALGSPPMMTLAFRLQQTFDAVELDLCDSSVGQTVSRLRSGKVKLVVVALWVLGLHLTHPTISLSYITEYDRRRDRKLNRFRRSRVIPISVPASLRQLESCGSPIDRIVLSGDFTSFHNQQGLQMLLNAVQHPGFQLPVQLFGPYPPLVPLPRNVTFHGWADSLSDIFSGNTAVFVSNIAGTGVPNKLFEAIAAGRPVIAHKSLAVHIEPNYTWFPFKDTASLQHSLLSLQDEGRS